MMSNAVFAVAELKRLQEEFLQAISAGVSFDEVKSIFTKMKALMKELNFNEPVSWASFQTNEGSA